MEKLLSVGNKYGRPPAELPQDLMEEENRLTTLVNRLHEFLPLIHFCGREAKALDLQLPYTHEEVEKNPRMLERSALGMMELERVLRQGILDDLQSKKNGMLFHGKFRWQELSLQLRRRINDVFDAVENEQKSGNWNIDDRARMAFEAAE